MLNAPPRAGEGVHAWLFRVSRQLHAHLPAGEIVTLLESRVRECGRRVTLGEIQNAVKNSIGCAWQRTGGGTASSPVSKWPSLNVEKRKAIAQEHGLPDLWELSRTRLDDNAPHTEEIIDHIFPGNPMLCCGYSSSNFDTKPREQWRGQLDKMQLIVPSPMSALKGLTQDGKESAHSLNNTGERRFLVCEFDSGTTDEHAAILIHLAHHAPLVCAVHSGGKSLHGWFLVAKQPGDKVLRFFQHAVSLGADYRLWTRSQFVRIPDGLRDNGKRQTVFYLNFKPVELL